MSLKITKNTIGFILISIIIAFFVGHSPSNPTPHIGVVKITGPIFAETNNNADYIIQGMRDASQSDQMEALILRINSTGGSIMQSSRIYKEIRRLQEKIPVYAVVEDVCQSAAYHIAAATTDIFASKQSMIGSIGIIQSFGIKRGNYKRRVITSVEHKDFLSPYAPVKKAEVSHATRNVGILHNYFVADVKTGRGDKLEGDDSDLFNGLSWLGEDAYQKGLTDGVLSFEEVVTAMGNLPVVDYTFVDTSFKNFIGRMNTNFDMRFAPKSGPTL